VEDKVPTHISFVLDGNRRWAKRQGLPTLEGHLQGLDAVFNVIRWCQEAGVKYLTTYAFSTENWNRAPEELDYLFNVVFQHGFQRYTPQVVASNVRVNLFGDIKRFPKGMQDSIVSMLERTTDNTGLIWNVCLDYGGRAELVRATQKIVEAGMRPEDITEEVISSNLFSAGMPEPDLMIRTGGEHRISNFLLWQQAYTEFYFPETGLPGFTKEEFDKALEWYASRDRRYGK
jgi:undecaprenyl diphosphate synthase